MPVPPENITRLDQRCNFIVENYWKTFNPKSSFSSVERLDHTLGTFMGFTPYATADTVHLAIDRLIDNVRKASPENLVTLARLVEKWTFCDTAEYQSEELYFPFVQAVATNKKAKGAERPRYVHHYKQLKNSRVGCTLNGIEFKAPDGGKLLLDSVKTQHILLFFYDPECTDCRLAKAMLSADYSINRLIDGGALTILAVYPGEADDRWREEAKSLPANWKVCALEDADEIFTMRLSPEIYYMDSSHKILAKDIIADNVLTAFHIN